MIPAGLQEHLDSGSTTLCRAWRLVRRDGAEFGFTDHDCDLLFDGVVHKAGSGLSARALQHSTGLSVDNTEAAGALTDTAIGEADLIAGRWDAAEVRIWLVNWADVEQRQELFRGSLGEVTRTGNEFRAELRSLAEALNLPVGQAYTRGCSAVLGDGHCRFDLGQPGFLLEAAVDEVDTEARSLRFSGMGGFEDRWFDFGRMDVLSGAAAGLTGLVKSDRIDMQGRRVELWQGLRATVVPGDTVRIAAGCDKRAETCRRKFANLVNFRGFPHIPGEDWLTAYPTASGQNMGGGSLFLRSSS